MSTEQCKLCGEDGTPYYHINGHICESCYFSSLNKNKKWISIKEILPEKEGYYLCTYIFDNHRFYYDLWFHEDIQRFATIDNITHWMPLPEPPDE